MQMYVCGRIVSPLKLWVDVEIEGSIGGYEMLSRQRRNGELLFVRTQLSSLTCSSSFPTMGV